MRCERTKLGTVAQAVVVCLLMASVGGVAEAVEALQVEAPSNPVAVGDRVSVTLTAPGGPRSWNQPKLAGEDGTWAMVEKPNEVGPGQWELVLVPLETGKLPIPAIRVTAADGSIAQAPQGSAQVTVASVLPPGTAPPSPAPLRDPVGVNGLPWEWLPPAAALLLPLALLGWVVAKRRRHKDQPEGDLAPELPPLEELLAALERMNADVSREPAVVTCDRLAASMRRFLERRVGEPAQEMTSFELFRMVRRSEWPSGEQGALRRVLETADKVRFARARIAEAELAGAIATAGDFGRALELRLGSSESDTPEEAA